MLTLNDGRSELWQWDTGRKLSVDADCTQVHFSNKVFGRSIDVDVVDGVAVIPDILLQTDKDLTAWAFVGTAENGYTKISKVFTVNKRNKPADYVFTVPDQTTLGEILDRIDNLENRPSGDVSKEDIQNAVNDYLDQNPVSFEEKDPTVPAWAKKPNKPTYTAAEVGALPVDTVIPEGGIPIPPTASVGQTIVVKAVDESGKPTEWEAADMASGGSGGGLKYFGKVTISQNVTSLVITNVDGTPLNAKRVVIIGDLVQSGSSVYINPHINDTNVGGIQYGAEANGRKKIRIDILSYNTPDGLCASLSYFATSSIAYDVSKHSTFNAITGDSITKISLRTGDAATYLTQGTTLYIFVEE